MPRLRHTSPTYILQEVAIQHERHFSSSRQQHPAGQDQKIQESADVMPTTCHRGNYAQLKCSPALVTVGEALEGWPRVSIAFANVQIKL